MKTILFFSIAFLITPQIFAQKGENISESGRNTVDISCSGTCSCSLEGILSGEESYVQCSCDDCTMQLEFSNMDAGDTTDYTLNDQTSIQVAFLEEFMTFVDTKFPDSKITSIHIFNDGDNEAVSFVFEDELGVEHSTMFAKIDGKKFQITCDGTCGCREVYSFETKSASCSCNECTMTVEEVSSN